MKVLCLLGCCLACGYFFAASGSLRAAEQPPPTFRYTDAMFRAALPGGGRVTTAPDYVLVTIRDANAGTARLICIEESFLEGALHREYDLPYDNAGQREVRRILLASPERTYTLSKPEALNNVEVLYTPAVLEEVRALLAKHSDEELRDEDSDELLLTFYFDKPDSAEDRIRRPEATYDSYCKAVAHALLERGILCCNGGTLSVVDPELRASEEAKHQAETAKSYADGATACRRLAGYEQLLASFEITDAMVGNISLQPRSLYVTLRAKQPGAILDAVGWFDPLDDCDQPTSTWYDFLSAYAVAEQTASNYPWLREQKKAAGPPHSVELHLVGTSGLELDNWELKNILLPVWQHAGMAGRPNRRILIRRGDSAWTDIYLSDQDSRAVVVSTSNTNAPPPQTDLDRLDVSWHPRGKPGTRSSRYAVVESDGRVREVEYVIKDYQFQEWRRFRKAAPPANAARSRFHPRISYFPFPLHDP